ncbi:hypothetical protein HUU53_02430 [Candidatus Micrarchaeota archaeon]|nr:hypothetical protein [Candidatus Micrarchaeota archaeon]
MKGQVSLFDGITFLLIAAVSSALVFSFVGGYGESEQRAINSAHVLNYMQSVVKTMYYVDASTLTKVNSEGIAAYEAFNDASGAEIWPEIDDPNQGCPALEKFQGSIKVTDLLKRDLADGGVTETTPIALNDYFGDEASGARVMGKTAMRCAMKELMKPFAFSGFDYFVEVSDPQNGRIIPVKGARITNSLDSKIVFDSTDLNSFSSSACESAQRVKGEVLSSNAPFRVLTTDTSGTQLQSRIKNYVIRTCIWKP